MSSWSPASGVPLSVAAPVGPRADAELRPEGSIEVRPLRQFLSFLGNAQENGQESLSASPERLRRQRADYWQLVHTHLAGRQYSSNASSGKQYSHRSPRSAEAITGCALERACRLACRLGDESQHNVTPQV